MEPTLDKPAQSEQDQYGLEVLSDTGSRSAYNWKTEKAQQQDPSHTINVLLVYSLPFGRGQKFSTGAKPVDALIGGWNMSSITTFRTGPLLGTIGAACNLPNAGGCYADYAPGVAASSVRINGDYGSGDVRSTPYLSKAAFQSPAAFTYGNTPRTGVFGIRGPSNYNESMSLKREIKIHENWKFAIQADAINVFNFTRFASPNLNITASNFGLITGIVSSPRVVQLNARLSF